MKRNFTAIGLVIVLLLSGTACRHTGHDRDMRDSGKMIRMRMGQVFRHHRGTPGMECMIGHGMRYRMMRRMGRDMGFGMMRGMHPGMGFGMMGGMGRMPMDSIGWMPMAPEKRLLESIPNVTDNQKKQMEDIIKKRNDELKKLREETFSKMQGIVGAHRKEMLNILTDEQKKFIESERGNTSPVPDEVK